jgi:tetratricopeptide (TPR) repeat protein
MRRALGLVMFTAVLVAPGWAQQPSPEDRREALEHYRSGVRLMSEENFEAAARELRVSTRLAPAFILAHYDLGRSLMALDQYAQAAASFATCRDLILSLDTPDLLRADQLAQSAWHSDPYAHYSGVPLGQVIQLRAQRTLRSLSERTAEGEARVPAAVYLALGSAYYRQGLVAAAEEAYRSAIAADPDLGPAHNNLAAVCMQTGRLEEARQQIEAAERAGYVVSRQFKQDLERRAELARVPGTN